MTGHERLQQAQADTMGFKSYQSLIEWRQATSFSSMSASNACAVLESMASCSSTTASNVECILDSLHVAGIL